MLDIKLIRSNPDLVREDLVKRGDKEKQGWLEDLLQKDKEYRQLLVDLEKMKAERNQVTKKIAELVKAKQDANNEKKAAAELPSKIKDAEVKVIELQEKVKFYLMRLPNTLHESVPVGRGEEGNEVVRGWGKKKNFDFVPKSHVDIIQDLDLADIERAAKISGSRFYFLKGDLVLLEQAVLNFAMNHMVKKGYTPISPPAMMKTQPYEGVTDLADFELVMYKDQKEDLNLIATSEHPIAAMYMDEILSEELLPLKYAGISPCYRKEAGAHGKDTKGIFRVHQFNKIEQYVFCKPEDTWKVHEELLKNAEEIFQALEIPYRVMNICTGDIGIVAAKKYDMEAWMPAQETYKEVVSCSNCTTYQSVRSNIKYGKVGGDKDFVHTLNSTAVASPRVLVAIMENYQNKDGSITVPKALVPFMGKDEISKKK